MAKKERYLWLLHSRLHSVDRIWWSYFHDWSELQVCLAELMKAFPAFELQRLETCPDGLRVLDYSYAATGSEQERADAEAPREMVSERERHLFPLAPLACEYLVSWSASLGDTVVC